MTEHKDIYEALAAAQGELVNPPKEKQADTGKYKYNYADIGDVLDAVRPVLSKHGISLTQPTAIREGTVILRTVLNWREQEISSEYPVCSINGNHQAMGSAMTYARRYALTSLIGIAAVDDTDGEGAAPSGEGQRVQMNANQAKTELNWDAIQNEIDSAGSFAKLDKISERIEQRKGHWPDTYYHKARERVYFNRLELAETRMGAAKDTDELASEMAELEGILHGKVQYDDLAGLFRKNEARLELAG